MRAEFEKLADRFRRVRDQKSLSTMMAVGGELCWKAIDAGHFSLPASMQVEGLSLGSHNPCHRADADKELCKEMGTKYDPTSLAMAYESDFVELLDRWWPRPRVAGHFYMPRELERDLFPADAAKEFADFCEWLASRVPHDPDPHVDIEPPTMKEAQTSDWLEYRTSDAARLLGCDEKTIRKYAEQKTNGVKTNRRGYFMLDHMHPFIKGKLVH